MSGQVFLLSACASPPGGRLANEAEAKLRDAVSRRSNMALLVPLLPVLVPLGLGYLHLDAQIVGVGDNICYAKNCPKGMYDNIHSTIHPKAKAS